MSVCLKNALIQTKCKKIGQFSVKNFYTFEKSGIFCVPPALAGSNFVAENQFILNKQSILRDKMESALGETQKETTDPS